MGRFHVSVRFDAESGTFVGLGIDKQGFASYLVESLSLDGAMRAMQRRIRLVCADVTLKQVRWEAEG